jgi:hypothetical protein
MKYNNKRYICKSNMKIRPLILALLIMLLAVNSSAQQLIRQSINTTGSQLQSGNLIWQQSAGQPAIIGTASNTTSTLRQGYIQPPAYSIEKENTKCQVKIWPNPTEGMFDISLQEEGNGFSYVILSSDGALVQSSTLAPSLSSKVNMEQYALGVYVVTIKQQNRICATEKVVRY